MRRTADVVVLGVGGFGSACLAHLARRGISVLGVDQFLPGHDRGSSHGETRIIRQAYYEHMDYVPLVLRAYEQWREFEAESGQSLMKICGLALAGLADGEAIQGSRLAAKLHGAEIQDLPPSDAADRLSGFRIPDGFEVVFEPPGGFLHVEESIRCQVDQAIRHGAQLAIGETVERWSSSGDAVTVQTNRGTIEAASLVIAAGAWASSLLSNIDRVPEIQVLRKVLLWNPVRTQSYSIENGGGGFLFELPHGTFYGFPSLDGKTLKLAEHSGGTPVSDPRKLDRSLTDADVSPVAEFIRQVMPDLDPQPARHSVCMYSMSPDGHFIVDRHPEFSNVVFGAGFSGHGFKFAPVIGEALADLALEGATDLPIDFLGLNRFSKTDEGQR